MKEFHKIEKIAGSLEIILEKQDDTTIANKIYYKGACKVSPAIYLDSEKIPCYFLLHVGGGYVEGEFYKNNFHLKKGARGIITTQAPTKVYKCENNIETKQENKIVLDENSVLEYISDNIILYKDAKYKQCTDIYMEESSTLIYSDGITSGWSPDGKKFQYNCTSMKTKIYMNMKLVLLDNLRLQPKLYDMKGLGFLEGYINYGTLIVINNKIDKKFVEDIREKIEKLDLDIKFGISALEVNGFVMRVLGNLTQNIQEAINVCINNVRWKLFDSKELTIRKY